MTGRPSTTAVFAHRGASAHAPENTLAAFQLALETGADGIELDVHLSRDGQVVVMHDGSVDRTTSGQGQVHELDLADIKALDAGSWFGPQFAGEPAPTLEEVLALTGGKIVVNIELKGFSKQTTELPNKVAELVKQYQVEDKIIFSSFDPRMLINTRRALPDARLGLLLPPGKLSVICRAIALPWVKPWSLHPHYASVTESYMRRAKAKGHPVFTYTANDPKDMEKLFIMGVDGIFTDDPAAALELRSEM